MLSKSVVNDETFQFDYEKPFGTLILAGGQGSRLGFDLPKGCFELAPDVSLFSLLISKSKRNNGLIAIMTSEQNDRATKDYFENHAYFGIDRDRVDFFIQESEQVVGEDHQLLFEKQGVVFKAPAGNGSCFYAFYQSGLLKKWKKRNVFAINVIPIDNLLANPIDPHLLGAIDQGYEIAIRGIQKEKEEKIGLLVSENEILKVLEYFEVKTHFETLGYSGLFAMSLSFFEKVCHERLPWHIAQKKAVVWKNEKLEEITVYKKEKFIFDVFPKAKKFIILNTCRKKYFCPLKDKEGPFGIAAVREMYKKVNI